MKRITLLVFSLLMLAGITYADQFQFLYRNGNETYYVSYSNVHIINDNNERIFNGYTDYYGRITVNLSNGCYIGRVSYLNKLWDVNIVIDGSQELKRIYLHQE